MVSRYCECSLGKVSTRKQGRNRKIQRPTIDGSVIHGRKRLLMAAVRLAHCLGDYLGDWAVRNEKRNKRIKFRCRNTIKLYGVNGGTRRFTKTGLYHLC